MEKWDQVRKRSVSQHAFPLHVEQHMLSKVGLFTQQVHHVTRPEQCGEQAIKKKIQVDVWKREEWCGWVCVCVCTPECVCGSVFLRVCLRVHVVRVRACGVGLGKNGMWSGQPGQNFCNKLPSGKPSGLKVLPVHGRHPEDRKEAPPVLSLSSSLNPIKVCPLNYTDFHSDVSTSALFLQAKDAVPKPHYKYLYTVVHTSAKSTVMSE